MSRIKNGWQEDGSYVRSDEYPYPVGNSPTTFKSILNHQLMWANKEEIKYDKKYYTLSLSKNLHSPMSPETHDEFSSGRGSELWSKGKPCKMQALYSSSALLVNVFEYWRYNRRIAEIAMAGGANSEISEMRFEKKYRIADLGTPHLDIEFNSDQPFVIESKFTEPFHKRSRRNNTNLEKYLARRSLWGGLPNCKKMAESVFEEEGEKTSWKYLDVPQLIKHILGLHYYKPHGFTLLYLWFDYNTYEAEEHEMEIIKFNDNIKGDTSFKSMTYQSLFENIRNLADVDNKYLSYLSDRYFSIE